MENEKHLITGKRVKGKPQNINKLSGVNPDASREARVVQEPER